MGEKNEKTEKTSLGLDITMARPLCYVPVLGVLVSIAFLVAEKSNKVKWDAAQAVMLWAAAAISGEMLNISRIGQGLVPLVNLVGMIVVPLVLAIKAGKNEDTKIPLLAEVVDAIMGKLGARVK